MTYYKLRKDTPTAKAGAKFKAEVRGYDSRGLLARLVPLDTSIDLQWKTRDIDNFDEWFEKVEEPTDSIDWSSGRGEVYWCLDIGGDFAKRVWRNSEVNKYDYLTANIYHTPEEAKKARERQLAEVRLRRTSTFKPDFENGNGGWVVSYNYLKKRLECCKCSWRNIGERVRYKTQDDAVKSIKENKKDWLIYFGVENG